MAQIDFTPLNNSNGIQFHPLATQAQMNMVNNAKINTPQTPTSPFNPRNQNNTFEQPTPAGATQMDYSKDPGTTTTSKFLGSLGTGIKQTAANLIAPIQGGAKNAKEQIPQAFSAGVSQIKSGFNQANQPGGNPINLLEGIGNIGAGAVNTAFSPVAPFTNKVSEGLDAITQPIQNNPTVQKFAQSKAGENTSRIAGDVANYATIAQTVGGIKAGPEVIAKGDTGLNTFAESAKPGLNAVKNDIVGAGQKVADTAGNLKDALQNKAGNVRDAMIEKQAASIDEKLGLQKNTQAAIKARKLGDLTGQKTPGQVLAENNIPLDSSAAETLQEHATARQATKQALLQTEGKWGNLDQWASQAKENLKLSGTALEKGKAIIDKELAAYKKQFASKGQMVDGELRLPLDQADKVKAGLGQAAYGKGLTTADQITKTAQGQFSQAIKHGIENTSENPFVKALNREEGDFLNAKNAIEGKDLSLLKTKPGILNRVVSKATGALAGGVGGAGGAVAGYEAGGYLANILAKVPENIRQAIINNLGETTEGQSLLSKVQDLIKQRQGEQVARPQLEASKTVYAPDKYQNAPNKGTTMKVTEPERTVFRNPKTGQMQRGFKTTSKP